jgi:hypothetical protein
MRSRFEHRYKCLPMSSPQQQKRRLHVQALASHAPKLLQTNSMVTSNNFKVFVGAKHVLVLNKFKREPQ